MVATNQFTVIPLKGKLRGRDLPTTGSKTQLIVRLTEADPEGNWLNEPMLLNDSMEKYEAQLQLERERNEVLRYEFEVTRRERDVARQEAEKVQRELELEKIQNLGIASPNRSLNDDLRKHLQQKTEALTAPQRPRADINDIGELLGEFDGSNRYFEDREKQVRLIKRL